MVLLQRRWMCLFCCRGEQRLNWITADLTLLLSVCVVVSRCTRPHRVTPAAANCRLKNCCCSSCCCQVDGGAAAGRPYTWWSVDLHLALQKNCPFCLPAAFWLDGSPPPPTRCYLQPELTVNGFFVLFCFFSKHLRGFYTLINKKEFQGRGRVKVSRRFSDRRRTRLFKTVDVRRKIHSESAGIFLGFVWNFVHYVFTESSQ